MSEYQYYEFQTADRRFSEKEMQELRAYSTRARITPTSFVNEYSFGNFKGNADVWMEKYFDGFLYLANWGTHILQLALPTKLLSATMTRLYCATDAASVCEKSGRVILSFISEDENGGDWVEGEGLLSSLMPLRTDLARGDLLCLYLGWLLAAQSGALDDDESEPAVPPNLAELSGPLSHFIDFLRIAPGVARCRRPSQSSNEDSFGKSSRDCIVDCHHSSERQRRPACPAHGRRRRAHRRGTAFSIQSPTRCARSGCRTTRPDGCRIAGRCRKPVGSGPAREGPACRRGKGASRADGRRCARKVSGFRCDASGGALG